MFLRAFFSCFFSPSFQIFLVPILVVSTSISSISIFSLLVIIHSTSVIISSVFGHLFSRPSFTAKYYRLGCHISTKDIKLTSINLKQVAIFQRCMPFSNLYIAVYDDSNFIETLSIFNITILASLFLKSICFSEIFGFFVKMDVL